MPALKLPIIPSAPAKPVKRPHLTMEQRVKQLEDYTDKMGNWAAALSRSLTAWSKQLDDLFNRGSTKTLQE